MPTTAQAITCTFSPEDTFAQPPGATGSQLHVRTPWLAGKRTEQLFHGFTHVGTHGAFDLYENRALLIGCARVATTDQTLAVDTRALYREILEKTHTRARRHHLYRIWNYVPHINRSENDKENYREFCRGRSLAFADVFQATANQQMPAASAVGCEGDALRVMFVAGRKTPCHLENPQQTPAYLYPPEHGPRAPSFARATVIEENQHAHIFIAGTASIKGHQTIAVGDLDGQIACTIDNLRIVSRGCGVGEDFGRETPASAHLPGAARWQRSFKVYLRHATDLARAQALLAPHENTGFLRATDHIVWLRSDICRANLDIEIEATLIRPFA